MSLLSSSFDAWASRPPFPQVSVQAWVGSRTIPRGRAARVQEWTTWETWSWGLWLCLKTFGVLAGFLWPWVAPPYQCLPITRAGCAHWEPIWHATGAGEVRKQRDDFPACLECLRDVVDDAADAQGRLRAKLSGPSARKRGAVRDLGQRRGMHKVVAFSTHHAT
ncbi:hypothetical protein EJ04DRAFT_332684 [Polyplosphaeria fusca]|uniref:Uncharacterized protein n=1 Tax=Polyplosphaeria fusca TaxID=682080 RepID=A0A9P4V7Q8_9PLEO|nr:hypothetical protein EJ04DRAFT_332684 [Polyplosphaeria fusca]